MITEKHKLSVLFFLLIPHMRHHCKEAFLSVICAIGRVSSYAQASGLLSEVLSRVHTQYLGFLPAGAASGRLSSHISHRRTQQAHAKSSSQESHSGSQTTSRSSDSSCR